MAETLIWIKSFTVSLKGPKGPFLLRNRERKVKCVDSVY
jgi:hypothetical protein